MSRLHPRLSYANVVSTLCLFIVLGGSATAAVVITGKQVKNSSLTGLDVRNSSLTGSDLKNNSVGSLDINDGDLRASDFKAGQLPTGAQGLQGSNGDTGATGGKGDPGSQGEQGVPGVAGAAGDMLPAGAVSFFNLSSCPSGWSELTQARGRFLVGLPSGGTLNGAVGIALTDQENRPVGQHNHAITDQGHSHGYSFTGSWSDGSGQMIELGAGSITQAYSGNTNGSTTGILVNNAGAVAGTNAPYLQLLSCVKG